jgi:pimeloyl-ACP methyl ester carboxylesterase
MKVKSGDAEIFYEVMGDGPAVVLLHAFPVNHNLWRPVAERLALRYRVVLPDLRGHGDSAPGDGPATMEKHASDLARVCDDAGIGTAFFGGVSIGGYVTFEFWRRFRERMQGFILCDTRAGADSDQVQAGRFQTAELVEKNGPDAFLDATIPRLMGESTRTNRPDLVQAARDMARKMTVAGIAAVQRGMAVRPDSVPTLRSISVPALLLYGAEDEATPPAEGALIKQHVPHAQLQVVPKAGHMAVFEQQEAAHEILRKFLDENSGR